MTEHRHYSGPDLAPLLRQVRDELGSDAEIIKAERIRSGGLAGFFAREHYEVVAKRPKPESSVSPGPAPSSTAIPDRADEPIADELIADELIADQLVADEPIADEPIRRTLPAIEPEKAAASTSTQLGPVTDGPTTAGPAAAAATRRSMQAALLDRADRVSTEELLVRVADTHSAEWGSESFQAILGRAMVDEAGPAVDDVSVEQRRGGQSPVPIAPDRRHESIGGLRLQSIRPGENVVDPVPPEPPDKESTIGWRAEQGAEETDRSRSTVSPSNGDTSWGPAPSPVPPPWANGAPASWGPPWMQGWAPWMINGWAAHAAGDPTPGATPSLLCARCAEQISPSGRNGDMPAPPTVDGEPERTDAGEAWSEVRRDIDDLRLRLDHIIGTLGDAAADGTCDSGREPFESGIRDGEPKPDHQPTTAAAEVGHGPGDRRRPVNARSDREATPGRPNRRGKNSRRSDRTGR